MEQTEITAILSRIAKLKDVNSMRIMIEGLQSAMFVTNIAGSDKEIKGFMANYFKR